MPTSRTFLLNTADVSAGVDLAAESAGLDVISVGMSRTFADDREQLRYGVLMDDALYVWCKDNAHTRMHR
ncbi:chromate resistance protein ChrB domain-containing protein [Paraburkholderia diazotrophica]|uniref:Chromate resistance exported protein n=1 Tax=Paraburkholderia diazotrophica TaxID=667676 RepID=A0A1H6Z7Q7_9BURK|nr:chromate resistance protein ChrB domain-containing protein [Paraburkholderia diazotrophica]SEJ45672.1 Chromate resistance exported protein [Paraburkholderia diazotrophica]